MATQRGRKSLSTAVSTGLVTPVRQSRLPAPAHLSEAERAVFIEVVDDQPAVAFTQTHAVHLEFYAKHVVQSRILANEIANFDHAWLADEDGLKRYEKLLAMMEREDKVALAMARSLRLTRQSIDQQTVARQNINAPKGRKPWEMATVDG